MKSALYLEWFYLIVKFIQDYLGKKHFYLILLKALVNNSDKDIL